MRINKIPDATNIRFYYVHFAKKQQMDLDYIKKRQDYKIYSQDF